MNDMFWGAFFCGGLFPSLYGCMLWLCLSFHLGPSLLFGFLLGGFVLAPCSVRVL